MHDIDRSPVRRYMTPPRQPSIPYSRSDVRTVACPVCYAAPGDPCWTVVAWAPCARPRRANHAERVQAFLGVSYVRRNGSVTPMRRRNGTSARNS